MSSATRVNPDLPITGNLNLTLVFVDDSSSPPTLRLYKFVLSSTIRTPSISTFPSNNESSRCDAGLRALWIFGQV